MVRQLASSLVSAGVETHVATTNDNARELLDVPLGTPVREDGVTYWYFPRQLRFYTASWPLGAWLAAHVADYSLVHIHALFSFATLPAAYWAHRRNVPYIVRPLGTLNQWGMANRRPWLKQASFRLLESRVVKHAALMHYTSDAERMEAESLDVRTASVVIPNAVRDAAGVVEPGAFRRRFGISDDRQVVLFLSRLDQKKGLDLLVRAFATLRTRVPKALLVLAGNGSPDFVARLRADAAAAGLTNADVVWAGFLAGEDKVAALADADVFVLPSYSENFGIAVAEAMAAAVPVVVSDQVAIHTDVASSRAGLVVPCDAARLAEALERVLSDGASAAVMGQRGAALVHRSYSTEAVTAKVIDAYHRVLDAAVQPVPHSRLGALEGHA